MISSLDHGIAGCSRSTAFLPGEPSTQRCCELKTPGADLAKTNVNGGAIAIGHGLVHLRRRIARKLAVSARSACFRWV